MSFTKVDEYGREYVQGSDGQRRYLRKRIEQEPQYGPGDVGFSGQPVAAPAPTATAVQEAPAAAPTSAALQELSPFAPAPAPAPAPAQAPVPGGFGVGVTPVTTFQTPGGTTGEVGTMPMPDLSVSPSAATSGTEIDVANQEGLERKKARALKRAEQRQGYIDRGVPVVDAKPRPIVYQEDLPGDEYAPDWYRGVERVLLNPTVDAFQSLSNLAFRDIPSAIGRPWQVDAQGRPVNPLPSLPRLQSKDGNFWAEQFLTDTLNIGVSTLIAQQTLAARAPMIGQTAARWAVAANKAIPKAVKALSFGTIKMGQLPAWTRSAVVLNTAGIAGLETLVEVGVYDSSEDFEMEWTDKNIDQVPATMPIADLLAYHGDNSTYFQNRVKDALINLPFNAAFELGGAGINAIWRRNRVAAKLEKRKDTFQAIENEQAIIDNPDATDNQVADAQDALTELRKRAAETNQEISEAITEWRKSEAYFGKSIEETQAEEFNKQKKIADETAWRKKEIKKLDKQIEEATTKAKKDLYRQRKKDIQSGKITSETAADGNETTAQTTEETPETTAGKEETTTTQSDETDEFGNMSTENLKASIKEIEEFTEADDNTKARLKRMKAELARREAGGGQATTQPNDGKQPATPAGPSDNVDLSGLGEPVSVQGFSQGRLPSGNITLAGEPTPAAATRKPLTGLVEIKETAPAGVGSPAPSSTWDRTNAVAIGAGSRPASAQYVSPGDVPKVGPVTRLQSSQADVQQGTVPSLVKATGEVEKNTRWTTASSGGLILQRTTPVGEAVAGSTPTTSNVILDPSTGRPFGQQGPMLLDNQGRPLRGKTRSGRAGSGGVLVLDSQGNLTTAAEVQSRPIIVDKNGNAIQSNVMVVNDENGQVAQVIVEGNPTGAETVYVYGDNVTPEVPGQAGAVKSVEVEWVKPLDAETRKQLEAKLASLKADKEQLENMTFRSESEYNAEIAKIRGELKQVELEIDVEIGKIKKEPKLTKDIERKKRLRESGIASNKKQIDELTEMLERYAEGSYKHNQIQKRLDETSRKAKDFESSSAQEIAKLEKQKAELNPSGRTVEDLLEEKAKIRQNNKEAVNRLAQERRKLRETGKDYQNTLKDINLEIAIAKIRLSRTETELNINVRRTIDETQEYRKQYLTSWGKLFNPPSALNPLGETADDIRRSTEALARHLEGQMPLTIEQLEANDEMIWQFGVADWLGRTAENHYLVGQQIGRSLPGLGRWAVSWGLKGMDKGIQLATPSGIITGAVTAFPGLAGHSLEGLGDGLEMLARALPDGAIDDIIGNVGKAAEFIGDLSTGKSHHPFGMFMSSHSGKTIAERFVLGLGVGHFVPFHKSIDQLYAQVVSPSVVALADWIDPLEKVAPAQMRTAQSQALNNFWSQGLRSAFKRHRNSTIATGNAIRALIVRNAGKSTSALVRAVGHRILADERGVSMLQKFLWQEAASNHEAFQAALAAQAQGIGGIFSGLKGPDMLSWIPLEQAYRAGETNMFAQEGPLLGKLWTQGVADRETIKGWVDAVFNPGSIEVLGNAMNSTSDQYRQAVARRLQEAKQVVDQNKRFLTSFEASVIDGQFATTYQGTELKYSKEDTDIARATLEGNFERSEEALKRLETEEKRLAEKPPEKEPGPDLKIINKETMDSLKAEQEIYAELLEEYNALNKSRPETKEMQQARTDNLAKLKETLDSRLESIRQLENELYESNLTPEQKALIAEDKELTIKITELVEEERQLVAEGKDNIRVPGWFETAEGKEWKKRRDANTQEKDKVSKRLVEIKKEIPKRPFFQPKQPLAPVEPLEDGLELETAGGLPSLLQAMGILPEELPSDPEALTYMMLNAKPNLAQRVGASLEGMLSSSKVELQTNFNRDAQIVNNVLQAPLDAFSQLLKKAKNTPELAIQMFLKAHESALLDVDSATLEGMKAANEALPAWARTAGDLTAALSRLPTQLAPIVAQLREAGEKVAGPDNVFRKHGLEQRRSFNEVKKDWPKLQARVEEVLNAFQTLMARQASLELEGKLGVEGAAEQLAKDKKAASEFIKSVLLLNEDARLLAIEAGRKRQEQAGLTFQKNLVTRLRLLRKTANNARKKLTSLLRSKKKDLRQQSEDILKTINEMPEKAESRADILFDQMEKEGIPEAVITKIREALPHGQKHWDKLRKHPFGDILADAHEEEFIRGALYQIQMSHAINDTIVKKIKEGLVSKQEMMVKALEGKKLEDLKISDPNIQDFESKTIGDIIATMSFENTRIGKAMQDFLYQTMDEDIKDMLRATGMGANVDGPLAALEEFAGYVGIRGDEDIEMAMEGIQALGQLLRGIDRLARKAAVEIGGIKADNASIKADLDDVADATEALGDSGRPDGPDDSGGGSGTAKNAGKRVGRAIREGLDRDAKAKRRLAARLRLERYKRKKAREARDNSFMTEGQQNSAEFTQGANAANDEANSTLQAGQTARAGSGVKSVATEEAELIYEKTKLQAQGDPEAQARIEEINQRLGYLSANRLKETELRLMYERAMVKTKQEPGYEKRLAEIDADLEKVRQQMADTREAANLGEQARQARSDTGETTTAETTAEAADETVADTPTPEAEDTATTQPADTAATETTAPEQTVETPKPEAEEATPVQVTETTTDTGTTQQPAQQNATITSEPVDGGNTDTVVAAASATGDAKTKVQGDSAAVSEDATNKQSTEVASAGPHKIGMMKTKDIQVNAKAFQYKQTFSKSGQVKESPATQASKYNASAAGVLHVWKDTEGSLGGPKGTVYVVNGHNRLALAKDPNKGPVPEEMAVMYLDAKNAQEARAYGALLNIVDRNGTETDAATFLRNLDVSNPELLELYAATQNTLLERALPLTRLSDDLFSAFMLGQIQPGHAIALGAREDLLPDTIDAIWRVAKERNLNVGQTLELVMLANADAAFNNPATRQQTIGGMESLFSDVDLSEVEGMAKVSAFVKRKLNSLATVLQRAGTTKGAATLESVEGNVIDQAQSANDARRYGELLANYTQLWTTTGPINDVIKKMAKKIITDGKVGNMNQEIWDEYLPELVKAIDEQSSLGPVGKDSLTTDTPQPKVEEDKEALEIGASTENDGPTTNRVDQNTAPVVGPNASGRLVDNNVDQPEAKADTTTETQAEPTPEPAPEPAPEPKVKLKPGQKIKRRADIPDLTDDQLAEQITLWEAYKDKVTGRTKTGAETTYKMLLEEQQSRQAGGKPETDEAPAPAPAQAPVQAKPKAQGQTKPKRVTKTTDLTQLSEAEIDEQLVLLRAYADAPNITARTRASREDLYAKVARQKELWGIKNTSREELPALIESLDAARKTEGLSDADKAIREEDYRTAYDEQLDRRNGTSTRGGAAETRTVMWRGKPTKLEKQPGLPIGVTVVNEANDKSVKLFDINSNNEVRDVITYKVDRSKIQNAKVLNEIDEYLSTAMRYDPDSTERLDRIKATRQAFIELLPPDERPSGGGGIQMFAGLPVSPELLNSLPTLSKWGLQSLPLRYRIEMAMLFQSMDEIGGWLRSTWGTKIAPAVAQQLRRLAPNTVDINLMAAIRNVTRTIDNGLAEVHRGISQFLGQELQLAMAADASSIDQLRSPDNPVWAALEPEKQQQLFSMLNKEQRLQNRAAEAVGTSRKVVNDAVRQEAIPPQPDDESLDLLDNFLDDTMGIMPPGSGDELISQKRESLLAERELLESIFPATTTPKQRQELRNQIDAVEYQMEELDRVEWQNGQQRKIAGIPVYNIQKLLRQARRVGFNALHPDLQRGLHDLIAQVRDVALRTRRQFDVEDQYQALSDNIEPTPEEQSIKAGERFVELYVKNMNLMLSGKVDPKELVKEALPPLVSKTGKPLKIGSTKEAIASSAALGEMFAELFSSGVTRQTDESLETLAQEWLEDGLDPSEAIKKIQPLIRGTGRANQVKLLGIRMLLDQYTITAAQAAGRVLSLNAASAPDADLVEAYQLLFNAMDQQRKTTIAYNKAIGQAGQTLRVGRIKLKKGAEPLDILKSFQEEVAQEGKEGMAQVLGRNITPEAQDAIKAVAEGSPDAAKKLRVPKVKEEVEQLAFLARSLDVNPVETGGFWKSVRRGAALGGQGLLLLRYSGLLSSGSTFWVNLAGTGLRVATQPIPQAIGAAISLDPKGVAMAGLQYVGMMKSLSDAWRLAGHSFKLGVGLWDPSSLAVETFDRLAKKAKESGEIEIRPEAWSLNRIPGSAPGESGDPFLRRFGNTINKLITMPTRLLNTTDTFWKALAGNGDHWARRYGEALEETGGNIIEAATIAKKRLDQDMVDVILYPDDKNLRTVIPRGAMTNQHALNYARQASFTDAIMAMPERRTTEHAVRLARKAGLAPDSTEGKEFVQNYISKHDGYAFDPAFLTHTRLISGLPQALNQLKVGNKALGPILHVTVPFIKTPTDIIKAALRWTPAAVFVDTWVRDVASQDVATRHRAIGEFAPSYLVPMGILAYNYLYGDETSRQEAIDTASLASKGIGVLAHHMLVSKDRVEITGGGPLGFKAKNKWMEQGQKRPNSYRVKQEDGSWGPWRSHRAYEPWSSMLGATSDYIEMAEGMTEEERAQAAAILSTGMAAKMAKNVKGAAAIGKGFAAKTWLQGIEELIVMFESLGAHGVTPPGRRDPVAKFFQRQLVTLVPFSSGIRRAARDNNPVVTTVPGSDFFTETWNEFKKTFTNGGVPLLNAITGEPIAIGGTIGKERMEVPSSGAKMFNESVRQFGFQTLWEPWQADNDPVMAEMFRLRGPGTDFTVPSRDMFAQGDIPRSNEMTAQEWNAYLVLRTQMPHPDHGGMTLHEALGEMIGREGYQNLPPEINSQMAHSLRAQALNKIIASYDERAKKMFLAEGFEPGKRIRENLEKYNKIKGIDEQRQALGGKDQADSAILMEELREAIRSLYQ